MSFKSELRKMGACREGIEWAGERTLAEIWCDCDRGDWLLWLARRVGVDGKRVVLAACACARLVLHAVPAGEDRPRIAIETAERWCRGEATEEEVQAAASAASAAYRAASDAAWAADPAADAALAAAWAAANAARAADRASEVVGHPATANAVRSVITVEMIEQAWRK